MQGSNPFEPLLLDFNKENTNWRIDSPEYTETSKDWLGSLFTALSTALTLNVCCCPDAFKVLITGELPNDKIKNRLTSV
jgi:hypothetical protein